jgi:hypothetical protein
MAVESHLLSRNIMDVFLDGFLIFIAIISGIGTIVGSTAAIIKYIRKPILDKLEKMDIERNNSKKDTTKALSSLHHQVQLVKAGNLILCEALMQHDDKINGKVKLFRDKYFKEVYSITNITEEDVAGLENDSLDVLLNDNEILDDL